MTKEELHEQSKFVAALLDTDPIQYLHKYLVHLGKAPSVCYFPVLYGAFHDLFCNRMPKPLDSSWRSSGFPSMHAGFDAGSVPFVLVFGPIVLAAVLAAVLAVLVDLVDLAVLVDLDLDLDLVD